MSVNWRASCLGIRNSVGLLAVSRSRIQTQLKLSYYTPVDSASSVFSSVRPPKSILSIFPSYTRELEMVKPPSTISRVLYSGLKGGKYGQTNGLCGKTWGIGDSYSECSHT